MKNRYEKNAKISEHVIQAPETRQCRARVLRYKFVEPIKKRHSVEQIIRILGDVGRSGLKISEQTYYRWRSKYGV